MSIEDNKRVVMEWFRLMSVGDYEGVYQLYSPDLSFTAYRWDTATGYSLDETKVRFGNVFPRFANGHLVFTVREITAEGHRVAVEAESLGVVVENGREYNNHYHFLFEVRDGKIVVQKEYNDTLHAFRVFDGIEMGHRPGLGRTEDKVG